MEGTHLTSGDHTLFPLAHRPAAPRCEVHSWTQLAIRWRVLGFPVVPPSQQKITVSISSELMRPAPVLIQNRPHHSPGSHRHSATQRFLFRSKVRNTNSPEVGNLFRDWRFKVWQRKVSTIKDNTWRVSQSEFLSFSRVFMKHHQFGLTLKSEQELWCPCSQYNVLLLPVLTVQTVLLNIPSVNSQILFLSDCIVVQLLSAAPAGQTSVLTLMEETFLGLINQFSISCLMITNYRLIKFSTA